MAGVRKGRQTNHDATQQAVADVTQAQFMIGIYAEIVAMDVTIIERVKQLLVRQSHDGDREAYVANLRLVLVQLERVGERISFWNGRVQALVQGQLR